MSITAEYARLILDYDMETGVFRWRNRPREHFSTDRAWKTWNARFACNEAGTIIGCGGYRRIKIDASSYRAHRLAWLYMTGSWPIAEIDHIDGCKGANEWANLREATHVENMYNKPVYSNNKSGTKGVSWSKLSGKWIVRIGVNGERLYLGSFDEEKLDDASSAYKHAASKLHGEFARHGE